jgi:hypothetical protein
LTNDEIVLGLPGYQITTMDIEDGRVRIVARYEGARGCPHCGGTRLRSQGIYQRRIRHQDLGFTKPPAIKRFAASIERKPRDVPSGA